MSKPWYESKKCLKCGRRPRDGVLLFNFPMAGGPKNYKRFEAWAQFCLPEEDWASSETQMKLFSYKQLCSLHFSDAAFKDFEKTKLFRYAVPEINVEHEELGSHNNKKLEKVDHSLLASSSRVTQGVSQETPDVSQETPSVSQETPSVSQERQDEEIETQDWATKKGVSQVKHYGRKNTQDVSKEAPDVSQEARKESKVVLNYNLQCPSPAADDDLGEELADDEEAEVHELPAQEQQELPFLCDNCNKQVEGFRFSCVSCSGRAVCGACVLSGAHGACYLLRVPPARPAAEVAAVLRAVRSALAMSLFADELAEPLAGYHYQCQSDVKSETADDDIATDALHDPLAGTTMGLFETPLVSSFPEKAVEPNSNADDYETDVDCQDIVTVVSDLDRKIAASEYKSNVSTHILDTKIKKYGRTHLKHVLNTDISEKMREELSKKKPVEVPLSGSLQKVEAKDTPSIQNLEKAKPKILIIKQKIQAMTSTVNPASTKIKYRLKPISGTGKNPQPKLLSDKQVKIISAVPGFKQGSSEVNISSIFRVSPSYEKTIEKVVPPKPDKTLAEVLVEQPSVVLDRLAVYKAPSLGAGIKRKITIDSNTTQKIRHKTSPS